MNTAAPRLRLRMQQKASATPSLAEQVYVHLKHDLFELALLPGEHFSETELVQALGVSRTPVRQALQQLAREGFVQVSQRNGWQVRPFDFERFEQLYDVRIVLELAAVERLCALPDVAEQAELQQLQRVWQVPLAERLPACREAALLDEAFHCTLVQATGNAQMAEIHRDITEKISIIRRLDFTQRARVDTTYEEHAAILQAVLRHRSDSARSLLRAHIEASKAEVRKITLHHLHTARAGRMASDC